MRGNGKFDPLKGGSLYGQKKASRIKFLQKEFIMEKNSGQFGKTVSRELALKLTRKSVCIFRIPQAKMSDAVWAEVQRFGGAFYDDLELHEKAAFDKLGASFGEYAPTPEWPASCWSEGEAEVGPWMFKDPSIWGCKSFIVDKWRKFAPEVAKIETVYGFFMKFSIFLAPVLFAVVVHLALANSAEFDKAMRISKLAVEFVVVIVLLKLLKVGAMLEFVAWKLLGSSAKFEFATICSGFIWLWHSFN